MATPPVMSIAVWRVFMVIMDMVVMDMARGLLHLDMVDMARLMFMRTVFMVLLVTMVVMDMARGLLLLSLDMATGTLPAMTTGSKDFKVTMGMVMVDTENV